MLKIILSGALLLGLMAVSVPSNAEILVNHHNQPFEESHARHAFQNRSTHKPIRYNTQRHYPQRHSRHYRSYAQHPKVVNHCLRMKNGQHYRVC
jgi:hypothetical protein